VNVQTEDADSQSMLTFYRELLTFRRGHAVWGTGDMTLIALDNPSMLAFVRKNSDEGFLVVESMSADPQEGSAQASIGTIGTVVWGSGDASISGGSLHVKLPSGGSAVFALEP
jgi:glycosidase